MSPAAEPERKLAPQQRPARRLGEILQGLGKLEAAELRRALRLRAQSSAPLGQVLRNEGLISPETLTTALAQQDGRLVIDINRFPPDPTLLEGMNPRHLLRLGALPWRMVDDHLVCVIAAPQDIPRATASLPQAGPRITFALAERAQIDQQIAEIFGAELAAYAAERCPAPMSCRTWAGPGATLPRWLAILGLAGAVALAPLTALALLLLWIAIMNAVTTALRAVALIDSFSPRRLSEDTERSLGALPPPGGLPVVSILVPLYDEDLTLGHLIDALSRQTYPKALLDVVFVLEEDDYATPLALAQIGLPPWARMVKLPGGPVRTKPRAMNYALEFCRGSIIGIYDAEDRPEPEQLTQIVAHLSRSGPEVGCVQGYLDFYNARQNWLARCFTIEYAIW
ncbi:MAG: glycosyltransferase, partial [Pseudomonadota bacterium]